MIKEKIGIIGLGNMGAALVKGLLKSKAVSPFDFLLYDKEAARLESIAKESGLAKATGNEELIVKSQGIILAVKPQAVAGILEETKEYFSSGKFIISIAAGISTVFIKRKIESELPVIRAMPNTPGQIGAGITAISLGKTADYKYQEAAKEIFQAFGEVIEVEEETMDLVTALSGSGPAYFFLIMEALIEAGENSGLRKLVAEKLVKETALGAAKLAKLSSENLSRLREKVTSPGGTTEAALKVFNEAGIKKIIFQAVEAAKKKSEKLSQ